MQIDEETRTLLEQVNDGALGTLEKGAPYVSSVGFIWHAARGSACMLLSDLARHTHNLSADERASLLVTERISGIPVHEAKRATLMGRLRHVPDEALFRELREAYLKIFPRAEVFFQLPDFRFYELIPEEIHWIGGFGKTRTLR